MRNNQGRFQALLDLLSRHTAIFQSVVEQVLTPVNKVCKNYIYDVVVYSACLDDHLVDLANVIRCLGEAGLTVKSKKCVFGRKYLQYLGHKIGGGVVAVPELRIKAMSEFLLPRTKKQLRSFWEVCPIIGNLWTVKKLWTCGWC